MATKIEYVDETWNPVTGCGQPISEGCEHCYARRLAHQYAGRFGYPKEDPFRVMWHPERLDEVEHWKRARRVLVCSMGDLFARNVLFEWVDQIFAAIRRNKRHIYLILTKRPWRLISYYRYCQRNLDARSEWDFASQIIHFGVTAENAEELDRRVSYLVQLPVKIRWLALEPMLEALPEVRQYLGPQLVNWVVVGGETGLGYRPFAHGWARSVRDDCIRAGVPFFFKSYGGTGSLNRLLDGREWNELPEVFFAWRAREAVEMPLLRGL